ncbi:MAG: response regulator [Candidatus Levybacteria bacterium]|nr:response regulator [Candidatus Levybacteria bacterium]
MKILLVDDDDNFIQVATAAFEKEGVNISIAKSGSEGINKAKQEKPDLILLDQVLTDITGNDVLGQIKADFEIKNIPILMISNFGHEMLVKQAIEKGAVDYVFKYQVQMQDIVDKVKKILSPTSLPPLDQ